jgi:DNA-binding transcriptional regulator YhcF (GntR family)
MILRIDPDSPVPAYEQLRAQLATMISTGVLPPGARLPSIRQLVTDLGLAANTIGRAYHELEQAGLLRTRGRHGTFVLAAPALPAPAERAERLTAAAEQFAIQARQLGVDVAEATGALRSAFDALPS